MRRGTKPDSSLLNSHGKVQQNIATWHRSRPNRRVATAAAISASNTGAGSPLPTDRSSIATG